MGKKVKPTVSIVTITQLKRFPCIEVLRDMIVAQTYKRIVEWIIVEGSPNMEDAAKNAENIRGLSLEGLKPTIRYLEKVPGEKLGALRNKGNRACVGNITVVMDDDDYYPRTRVQHAVESLSDSKALIAGCSGMIIYDYILEKIYQFRPFGPYHSVNSCMAWKKEYIETHAHDDSKETGEEASFTNEFKEPMIQLDAAKSIIQSSHSFNTYNKREILTGGSAKINPTLSEINVPITDYIPEEFFVRLKSIFVNKGTSPYDIVYMLGGFSPAAWQPTDKNLGGSEQAVVHLTTEWVKAGKRVAVYGQCTEGTYNGVVYIDWKKFPFQDEHHTVILWRGFGLLCGASFTIKAKNIWLDLHDGVVGNELVELLQHHGSKITKFFFKGQYHRELFEKFTSRTLSAEQYTIIPNGIRIDEFSQNKDNVSKNTFRCCYCSCYTRGLAPILQFLWPIVMHLEPRAELHVYYGMNGVRDENFKKHMQMLLSQPGVMDHGRQPVEMIAREKYMSGFHLYLSTSDSEIDCISVRESLLTGAIPILTTYGVFKEREGVHFDAAEWNPNTYRNVAVKIVELMRSTDINGYRHQLRSSSTIVSWKQVAEQWLTQSA